MGNNSEWYTKIINDIENYITKLNKKEQERYKLKLLLRIVKRVESYSDQCMECQKHQYDLVQLVEELGRIPDLSKEEYKKYAVTLDKIMNHLMKEHKLISEGQYIAIGMALGMCFGMPLAMSIGNIALGPAMGLPFGVAIGVALESDAKKKGKVI